MQISLAFSSLLRIVVSLEKQTGCAGDARADFIIAILPRLGAKGLAANYMQPADFGAEDQACVQLEWHCGTVLHICSGCIISTCVR